MASGPENSGNEYDVWQLGERLVAQGELTAKFLSHRDPNLPGTHRKMLQKITELQAEYTGKWVYAQAPLEVFPLENGIGIGPGETSGKIVGFGWGSVPTINEQLEEGPSVTSLILFIGTGGLGQAEAKDAAAWRTNVLEAVMPNEVDPIDTFIIGVPLRQGVRIAEITGAESMPASVAELLNSANETAKAYEYMDYVRRIDAITDRRASRTVADTPWVKALEAELHHMNFKCPYLGRTVQVEAELMRAPNPEKPESFLLLRGSVNGVLRKFVYQPYMDGGEVKGGVQAVIYHPETAQRVQAGSITPQQADKLYSTVYVPLSGQHSLLVRN